MVVDDQRLTRLGIALMLRHDPDAELVAEAQDGQEAVDTLDTLSLRRGPMPDVVLMDARMPRLDGIGATRLVTARYPGIRVLVLTTYDQDDYAFGALAAGASGFLLKDATARQLCDAVHAVAHGEGFANDDKEPSGHVLQEVFEGDGNAGREESEEGADVSEGVDPDQRHEEEEAGRSSV